MKRFKHSPKTEGFDFANLEQLRDWLNRFKTTDLSKITSDGPSAHISLRWKEGIDQNDKPLTEVNITSW